MAATPERPIVLSRLITESKIRDRLNKYVLGTMKREHLKWCALGLLGVYLLLPVLAGVFRWSDKRGPKIYPELLHEAGFYLGMKLSGGNAFFATVGRQRPWFYVMKTEPEPWLQRLEKAKQQESAVPPSSASP